MKDFTESVGFYFLPSMEYVIPRYQRKYTWNEDRWHGLIQDVMKAATSSMGYQHWLGVIILSELSDEPFSGVASKKRYSVIDGQQRLITLSVWQAALYDFALDQGITDLVPPSGLASVTVQDSDKFAYGAAINQMWREPKFQLDHIEVGALAAYNYFRWVLWLGGDALLSEEPVRSPKRTKASLHHGRIEDWWSEFLTSTKAHDLPPRFEIDVKKLWVTTQAQLSLHCLIHEPNRDEAPEEIFDSLNGQRTELEPLDHVRNSIFIRLNGSDAENLYDQEWKPNEGVLTSLRTRRVMPGTLFIYDYVISKGEYARQGMISTNRGASHFTRMTRNLRGKELITFIQEDFLAAMAAWPVVICKKKELVYKGFHVTFTPRALSLVKSIRELSQNPPSPIVLRLLTEKLKGKIDDAELEKLLFLTENYLVRYILSGEPLSPLRAQVMRIVGDLGNEVNESNFSDALANNNWKSDKQVKEDIRKRQLYGAIRAEQLMAIFRGIERKLSGGTASNPMPFGKGEDEFTIEHIYPQDDRQWSTDLKDWDPGNRKMPNLLHTLGNLTAVTGRHNKAVGNKRFATKRSYPTEPGKTPALRLNEDWIKSPIWGPNEIVTRTDYLVDKALLYWLKQA